MMVNAELENEMVALRNRMDAAEAALAQADRDISTLFYTIDAMQTFLLRCTIASNPGKGGK